jgi:spore coat protein CotF
MSKILKSIVGLAIITSTIGLAATPAQAESKAAQCKRFDKAMVALTNPHSLINNPSNNAVSVDQFLGVMSTGLKKLQRSQFSDPKIRGFQQSALNIYADLHDNLISMMEAKDQATAVSASQQLSSTIEPEAKLKQQFVAYCGRAK